MSDFHLYKQMRTDIEILEIGTLANENELLRVKIGVVLQVKLPEVDAELDVL